MHPDMSMEPSSNPIAPQRPSVPQQPAILPSAADRELVKAALRDLLREDLLADPMTVKKLAAIWNHDKNKMLRVLLKMPGAVQDGSTWRVPLLRFPHSWLIRQGILPTMSDAEQPDADET